MSTEDSVEVQQVIQRLKAGGSEHEILSFAKQVMQDADYQLLNCFHRQGYAIGDPRKSSPDLPAIAVYHEWCLAFERPYIIVVEGITICINLTNFNINVSSFTPDQMANLEAAGWSSAWYRDINTLWALSMSNKGLPIKTVTQEALGTLGLEFEDGPFYTPWTRYNVLMAENTL